MSEHEPRAAARTGLGLVVKVAIWALAGGVLGLVIGLTKSETGLAAWAVLQSAALFAFVGFVLGIGRACGT